VGIGIEHQEADAAGTVLGMQLFEHGRRRMREYAARAVRHQDDRPRVTQVVELVGPAFVVEQLKVVDALCGRVRSGPQQRQDE
jgi:hypothetical protein